jgi:hypothetical protein
MKVCGLLEGRHKFLKEYQENGSQKGISVRTELVNDLQIEPMFQSVKTV